MNKDNEDTASLSSKPLNEARIGELQILCRWITQHKAGGLSLAFLILLGLTSVFADFLSFHPLDQRISIPIKSNLPNPRGEFNYIPPIWPSLVEEGKLRWPYLCARRWIRKDVLKNTWKPEEEDCTRKFVLRFFVHVPNYKYKLLGIFETDIHLFGMAAPDTPWFLGTADPQAPLLPLGSNGGRKDLFSLILVGSRASLGISLGAVILSLLLTLLLGGFSEYLGGRTDTLIQRIIDGVMAFPRLLLLLVLGATIVDPKLRLWGMVLLLGLVGWAPIARTLRGQILSLREVDFIEAARASGAGPGRIFLKHMLPQTLSTVVVAATLAVPNVLVLESFLSYLGRGVPETEKIASWGLLLEEAAAIQSLPYHPWVLFAGVPIILTVLAFTFLGDALRDWFDPFSQKGKLAHKKL